MNFSQSAYALLLEEARQVADLTVERLRALHEHFPGDIPREDLVDMDHLRRDPAHERRRGVRRHGRRLCVQAWRVGSAGEVVQGWLIDRAPCGFGLLLLAPADAGTLLEVRLAEAQPELAFVVEVKHCRPHGDGWLAGCELLGEHLSV